MSLFAFYLVAFSALMHAVWNVISKSSQQNSVVFSLTVAFVPALLLLPYLIFFSFNSLSYQLFPASFWFWISLSGASQALYILMLTYAYRYGDMSTVYPLVRALPILMVAFGTTLLGVFNTERQWFGFFLIFTGCLFTPLRCFSQFSPSFYQNKAMLFIFLSALGTAGYSLIDKIALDGLGSSLGHIYSHEAIAVFYLGAQFWTMGLALILFLIFTGQSPHFKSCWPVNLKSSLAGIIMAATYALVLWAMMITDNVSLVIALRQLSIVFGMLFGIFWFREQWFYTRVVGTGCITVGLVLALVC